MRKSTALIIMVTALLSGAISAAAQCYMNPILKSGADPWIVCDGTVTEGGTITIARHSAAALPWGGSTTSVSQMWAGLCGGLTRGSGTARASGRLNFTSGTAGGISFMQLDIPARPTSISAPECWNL